MKVVYILNDSCFYRRLCWFSINSLRYYNKSIEIEILYICDNGRDHRHIANYNEMDLGIPWFTREMFIEEISKFNVTFRFVYDCEMGEENGFNSAQRVEFVKIKGEDVLLMDSDTFVLDDVEPLFDYLKDYDVVADKTEWGAHGGYLSFLNTIMIPFNSGVILFKGNLIQQYGAAMMEIALDIKHERNEVGKWYGNYERENNVTELIKSGREEMAFSYWVIRENLKYKYFEPHDVQTVNLNGSTRIYHTMTQNWPDQFKRFYRGAKFLPPKKIARTLFMRVK